MKYLQNKAIRIALSIFGGGMASELIHISTGDPNRPTNPTTNFIIIVGGAIIIYYVLTNLSKKKN
jgi:hypothetical protein